MKRKLVTQEHGTGCAVACVAYALSISYPTALKLFEQPHQAWGRGFFCPDIVRALRKGGRPAHFQAFRNRNASLLRKPGSIVYVGKSKQYPLGHYLIRTQQGDWMNPWANFPCINPARAAFQRRLPPGRPLFCVFWEPEPA